MQTITGTGTQNAEFFSQEHLHLIYRYVYSYVRNQQEAEDLTSQIFLNALRHLDPERSAQQQQLKGHAYLKRPKDCSHPPEES
jgi:DNA-directed RNA polymerase specialized sigma24 family protein